MTSRLSEALHGLADGVPAAAVPDELFDRARARRRHRRAATAGMLAVLVLLLGAGYALRPGPVRWPATADSTAPGLPTRLVDPPLRTATVGRSAPGAAAMLFGGPAVRDDWKENRMAVVAADTDRYRALAPAQRQIAGFEALLSPDGRYVWAGGLLYDLTSGRSAPAGMDGYPLAFAPDGKRLAYAEHDTFTPPNTYATPYVGLYDRDRHTDVLRMRVGSAWVAPGQAAVSPDGGELAVQVRDEVWLTRVVDAEPDGTVGPYRKLPLHGGRLPGAGSWLPDGRSVATLTRSTCTDCPVPSYPRTWRLETRTVADGTLVPGPAFPDLRSTTYVHLVGWRSADEAVALVGVPGPAAVDYPETHDIATSPYQEHGTASVQLMLLRRGATSPEVLFRTPAGVTELTVAASLAIDGTVRESGRPDFGPPPMWLVAAGAILTAIAGAAIQSVVAYLRRNRRRGVSGRK
ncbi:hypothetical protein ACFFMR_14400 [Micromonospora andamanensis]|uniref:Uncharacterized protein n=1 Tax=Micromonospora andamanensis TaxID=1287068 RepID=A0ABQ4I4B8_9ACTN|nr:hypothetical protein [Micromonospora andamanensis]GIJ12745.1 hypothetical protein Van01_59590 [Micromonospora andamanensis]GIJ39323.1 hypothetical protein Vwe01_26480 [Micromonospora andamanensis]